MSHLEREREWDGIAQNFSNMRDARREVVFSRIYELLREAHPAAVLDHGGGDGLLVRHCSNLGIPEFMTYDPAPAMRQLARRNLYDVTGAHVIDSLDTLSPNKFDVITQSAVWMCLPDEPTCLATLRRLHELLRPGGLFIASVTHPCFRNVPFSTFRTDFDPTQYLANGTQFRVTMGAGAQEVSFEDTHWNLQAMSTQLFRSGFLIRQMFETPDAADHTTPGSPWLIIVAQRNDAPVSRVTS